MKRTRVSAIDVGTTKVCTIMGDIDSEGGLRILGVGIAPSHGLQKALVVNVNEAKESIRASVRRAEQTAGYRLESAYVGVTGRHIVSANNRGVVSITRNDRLVRPEDLRRVLAVAKSIKVPSDSKLLHMIPRSYAIDGQDGVKNPVGMHGMRLDVEAHIITAGVTSVQNLTKCIRGIGVDIDDLVLEPLASGEAVLSKEEKETGVLIADIGGGTTDIAVFKDNSIYHTSVLPVAGYQVTQDISVGLGISFDLAEAMKKKYGSVLMADDQGDGDKTITEDGHSVSYHELSEIVRIRMEELLRLIVLELPRTDYNKLIPSGLVLTGGASNLLGIDQMATQLLRIPVRIGRPVSLSGVSDVLDDPAYATSVGLLLWKMRNKVPGAQSFMKKESSAHSFFSRIFRIFQ